MINMIWKSERVFADDLNFGLTKLEYAAIQIFATAMANKMKTFSNPDELTLKGEIASEVFNVAYSSWYFAKRLQEVGYDMLSDGDI